MRKHGNHGTIPSQATASLRVRSRLAVGKPSRSAVSPAPCSLLYLGKLSGAFVEMSLR
ncbi:hypothetical protein HW132_30460 [Brasilonema sp. CT11]|nr:hypothetical protein [Brasilonema sp. CT11]